MAAIFAVFWAPWGVKIDSQTALGGGQKRSLEGPWRLLEASYTSGGVLGGAAGIPEGSGSRLGGLLGPNGSHFGTLFASFFVIHFEIDF